MRSVGHESDAGWWSGGSHLLDHRCAARLRSDNRQHARRPRHHPCEAITALESPSLVDVAADGYLDRRLAALLRAEGGAVEEQLHLLLVGVDKYRDRLPLVA